jgi:hypothetical protein
MEKNYSQKIIAQPSLSRIRKTFDQTKGNKVFPLYKTSFLELATPFLPNITKTPEQSCSTMEF